MGRLVGQWTDRVISLLCRGDVVVSRSMSDPQQLICKRVRGLEGDNINSHGSALPVSNNKKVDQHQRFTLCSSCHGVIASSQNKTFCTSTTDHIVV